MVRALSHAFPALFFCAVIGCAGARPSLVAPCSAGNEVPLGAAQVTLAELLDAPKPEVRVARVRIERVEGGGPCPPCKPPATCTACTASVVVVSSLDGPPRESPVRFLPEMLTLPIHSQLLVLVRDGREDFGDTAIMTVEGYRRLDASCAGH